MPQAGRRRPGDVRTVSSWRSPSGGFVLLTALLTRQLGSNLDWNIEHQKRQRLAVAIEADAGVDAPFENVIENEIECGKLGQIVADSARGLARGESLGHA